MAHVATNAKGMVFTEELVSRRELVFSRLAGFGEEANQALTKHQYSGSPLPFARGHPSILKTHGERERCTIYKRSLCRATDGIHAVVDVPLDS